MEAARAIEEVRLYLETPVDLKRRVMRECGAFIAGGGSLAEAWERLRSLAWHHDAAITACATLGLDSGVQVRAVDEWLATLAPVPCPLEEL